MGASMCKLRAGLLLAMGLLLSLHASNSRAAPLPGHHEVPLCAALSGTGRCYVARWDVGEHIERVFAEWRAEPDPCVVDGTTWHPIWAWSGPYKIEIGLHKGEKRGIYTCCIGCGDCNYDVEYPGQPMWVILNYRAPEKSGNGG